MPRLLLLLALCLLALALPALATEEYAARTGKDCSQCHLDRGDPAGLGGGEPPSALFRSLRLAVRFAHLFFGVLWLGTIFYIHIVLKPRYAFGGLPRKEVRLAWVAMPGVAATGAALAAWMLRSSPELLSTRFGHLLAAKTAVFLVMVASAAFVTRFVGPRLAARARALSASAAECPGVRAMEEGLCRSPAELAGFDGKEGRRALVAVGDKLFDVTGSRLWKDGVHARRHQAGQDLTEALSGAPHGAEVLERMRQAGRFSPAKAGADGIIRLFTALAYFNLAAGTAILLLVALWKW